MTRYNIEDIDLRKEDSLIDILNENNIEFDIIENILIIFNNKELNIEELLNKYNINFEKLEDQTRVYQFEDGESFEIALETLYMLSVDYNYSPDSFLIEIPLDNLFAIENSLTNAKIDYTIKL